MPEALLIVVGCLVIAGGLGSFRYGEQWFKFFRRVGGADAFMAPTRIAQVAKFDRVGAVAVGVWFLVVGSCFVLFGIAMASR